MWFLLLNKLSLSFVQTPNKFFRFRGFSRSYINHLVVVPTIIKVTLLFCLMYTVQIGHVPFLQLFKPNITRFGQPIFIEHTSCANVVNFKVSKEIPKVWNSYSYIHQLQNNVFSQSPFSWGGKLLHIDMVWTEQRVHMPLHTPKCYIAPKWACCFLVATAISSVIENLLNYI